MAPTERTLRFYTRPSDAAPLEWSWVDEQLAAAGTYWVIGRGDGAPHPRPVWGVWLDGSIRLTLGSPVLRRVLADDPTVTVHLGSGTDVVIVEGRAEAGDADPRNVEAYDQKYDYSYDMEQYGPFVRVTPTAVLAWRAAGEAGRDGFTHAGHWSF
jgi:hypothetical protein